MNPTERLLLALVRELAELMVQILMHWGRKDWKPRVTERFKTCVRQMREMDP